MEKMYEVSDAVWIAAALYAYKAYETNPNLQMDEIYATKKEIKEIAEQFTNKTVDDPRIYYHCNADQKDNKNAHKYLRRISKKDGGVAFRVTATGEFEGGKECPALDWSDKIDYAGQEYSLEEIKKYIDTTYANFIKELQPMDGSTIDYIGVLEYLQNNQEIPYFSPDAPGITDEKRTELFTIKQRGQDAVAEMKKMANRCSYLYGLDKCLPGSWLDGSNTKTRKYLWTQMKYKEYEDNPVSVSLFVENNDGVSKYHISLEIKNDGADKATMITYHSHLDIPMAQGMRYVTESNTWGNPETINETQESIKEKIASGEIRKAQLCVYVEPAPGKTNQQYDEEVMGAVKKLIPYYEHVIGIQKTEYWPSLDYYNPGITKEKWLDALQDTSLTTVEDLRLFKCWLLEGGESTCANVAEKYGGTPSMYNMRGNNYADKIKDLYHLEPCNDDGKFRTFPILFVGRNITEKGKRRYSWKLRDELKEALEDMDLPEADIILEEINTTEFDKNMILYGPPGTGKTYSTAKYAVAICDGDQAPDLNDYSAVMQRYRELMKENRIAFVTFHQSYGYEEFIEGIKPKIDSESKDVEYTIKDGVFKEFCIEAQKIEVVSNEFDVSKDASIWKATIRNEVIQDCYDNNRVRIDWGMDSDGANGFVNDIRKGDIILTTDGSRTYINGIAVVTSDEAFELDGVDGDKTTRNVKWFATKINIDITKLNDGKILHRMTCARVPHMLVEDVVEFAMSKNRSMADVEIKKNEKLYVFVIDEINRGNISKIFGELITLIEDTKREGLEECVPAILPYSGDPFTVPNNVYILGTMNTADRSIALMDTALRRRFSFVEMLPDHKLFKDVFVEVDGISVDIELMLKIINDRITYLYDREHTIGHAIFMGLLKDNSIDKLASIFAKSVIPLLQEYFYEDYEKIRLVLGDNAKKDTKAQFIVADNIPDDIFEGDLSDEIDIPEKSYTIAYENFTNIMVYKGISKNL